MAGADVDGPAISTPKAHGPGHVNRLTAAGEDLADVLHSLSARGER
jgi:hypothetical protein